MIDLIPRPRFTADHVSWTVADLDAAVRFYVEVIGARELWRVGPIDAADIPRDGAGRDWMETHVGVPGARLRLVMLKLTDHMNLQLVQYDKPAGRRTDRPRNCDLGGHHLGLRVDDVDMTVTYLTAHGCRALESIAVDTGPLAGKKNVYVLDPFGNQLEIVD